MTNVKKRFTLFLAVLVTLAFMAFPSVFHAKKHRIDPEQLSSAESEDSEDNRLYIPKSELQVLPSASHSKKGKAKRKKAKKQKN